MSLSPKKKKKNAKIIIDFYNKKLMSVYNAITSVFGFPASGSTKKKRVAKNKRFFSSQTIFYVVYYITWER